jgi:hypothetical protein
MTKNGVAAAYCGDVLPDDVRSGRQRGRLRARRSPIGREKRNEEKKS